MCRKLRKLVNIELILEEQERPNVQGNKRKDRSRRFPCGFEEKIHNQLCLLLSYHYLPCGVGV